MSIENLNNNDLNNEEINTSGFDAITKTFEKIYPEQKEPKNQKIKSTADLVLNLLSN